MTATLATGAFMPSVLKAQPQKIGKAIPQFSVMMWTLRDRGSFEENLERVAQAGYHHVELVNEYKKWS
jgi:hydroxypyruvate isomerase